MFCPVLGRYVPTWVWGFVALSLGVALGLNAPPERTLGTGIRAVYLHGAWIWTALLAFGVAAVLGFWGLKQRDTTLQRHARAWGWVATGFWLTAFPLTLWAMQVNWNGLFLVEPRWRLNVQFGVLAVLLQGALALLPSAWSGPGNALFLAAYLVLLAQTPLVLHPPAPVFRATDPRFPLHFVLTVLTLLIAAGTWARALTAWQSNRKSFAPGGSAHGH